VVNVMAPVHTGVPSAPTGNRSETLLQSQPMLFSLHEGKAPPSSTSFFRKLAILGTCAAGAVAAALAAAAGGSDSKLGASTSRLCGAALSALGGAALTVSASDLFPSGPLWRLDNGRRKRAASVTRPSMQVSQLSEETITLATILLQQASDEAEEGSPNAPHTNQSNHVSGRQASEFPDTTEALENRLFELLEGYSLQHLQDADQLQEAPWATLLAHQRLESTISQMSYEELCRQFNGQSSTEPSVRDIVKALPCKAFQHPSACSSTTERAETHCPICLDDFREGQSVKVLPQCGHCYCVGCVDQWLLSHSRSCPTCRCDV